MSRVYSWIAGYSQKSSRLQLKKYLQHSMLREGDAHWAMYSVRCVRVAGWSSAEHTQSILQSREEMNVSVLCNVTSTDRG